MIRDFICGPGFNSPTECPVCGRKYHKSVEVHKCRPIQLVEPKGNKMAIRYPRAIGEDDPIKLKEFEESQRETIAAIIESSNRQAREFEEKCKPSKASMEAEYTI